MRYYFDLAAKAAIAYNKETDLRNHLLGAVGLRRDGKLVSAKNGAVNSSSFGFKKLALSHAEARLCRKLGKDGIVYVARVAHIDGNLAMARPCSSCQRILLAHNVKKVFYTINEKHFGLFLPHEDRDQIFQY